MEFSEEWLKRRGLICNGYHNPYNGNHKERVKRLRRDMTPTEKKLWFQFLKPHEVRFYSQRAIDHYIVDFYCASRKLVIEVDGKQHYTVEGMAYDDHRTDILKTYGLTVIRFSNDDVRWRFEEVCRYIESFL